MKRLSWVGTPITAAYRAVTPQMIQDAVSSTFPVTLEGDCKAKLKKLAQVCLVDLKKQLDQKENQIRADLSSYYSCRGFHHYGSDYDLCGAGI